MRKSVPGRRSQETRKSTTTEEVVEKTAIPKESKESASTNVVEEKESLEEKFKFIGQFPEITKEYVMKRRHEISVHEAGHAVVGKLCGFSVLEVRVLSADDDRWFSRQEDSTDTHIAFCRYGELPLAMCCIIRNGEEPIPDKSRFNDLLDDIRRSGGVKVVRKVLRETRGIVCRNLAGVVAEEILKGEEDIELEDLNIEPLPRELSEAWAISELLEKEYVRPRYHASVYDWLGYLTEGALRLHWDYVLRLADELEKYGVVEGEALDLLLPARDGRYEWEKGWGGRWVSFPPARMLRGQRPYTDTIPIAP